MKLNNYKKKILFLFFLLLVFASSTKSQNNYYPLEKGYRWEYDMSFKGPLATIYSNNLSFVLLNNGKRKVYNKFYFEQEFIMKGRSYCILYKHEEDGLKEYGKYNPTEPLVSQSQVIYPEPKLMIEYPLRVGATWLEDVETSLIREKFELTVRCEIISINKTVSVPAGTFKNVLQIYKFGHTSKDLGLLGRAYLQVEYEEWYALNVGLIKSRSKEVSKQSWIGSGEAEITLYSFSK